MDVWGEGKFNNWGYTYYGFIYTRLHILSPELIYYIFLDEFRKNRIWQVDEKKSNHWIKRNDGT